jgi:hypothetical protein
LAIYHPWSSPDASRDEVASEISDDGDPHIQRGLRWLEANQRASGRWYTRSLYRDTQHFITHAGTAMAVMALEACRDEEIQPFLEIDHE